MEDAEAEAVLLSLGAQLQWKQQRNDAHAEASHGFYSARAKPGPWCSRVYEVSYIGDGTYSAPKPEKRYENLSAAKAACECHYATGKWE